MKEATETVTTAKKKQEFKTPADFSIADLKPKETSPGSQPKAEAQITQFDALQQVLKKMHIPAKWRLKKLSDLEGPAPFLNLVNRLGSWDFKDPVSVTILGKNNGIGKTHIAVCLMKKFIADNIQRFAASEQLPKMFYFDSDVFRRIQESYRDNAFKTETQILNELISSPFLVLDDIFSNRKNEFSRRIILDIVNRRIDWEGRPTVFTSNLSIEEINEEDSRIASRLNGGLVIDLNKLEKDFREYGAKK